MDIRREDTAEYQLSLAKSLLSAGQSRQAEAALRRAIAINPSIASAHMYLGAVLVQQNNFPDAESAFLAANKLEPNNPEPCVNLGNVCRWQQRLDEAIAWHQRAIDINPNFVFAYNAMGSALRESGQIGRAVAAFKKAIEIQPANRMAHSNLLYAMHFDPDTTPDDNFAQHLRWSDQFAAPFRQASAPPHPNSPDPDRRLRIAYVSPDFKNHPVGLFMESVLAQHDHGQFEIFGYSDVRKTDDMTQRLQSHADVWRASAALNDQQLAQFIRNDGIDVLIDLTQHMRHSRLLVFAQKPAPVQIAFLGYCATTGLRTMDWCITDPHLSPPGPYDRYFTERLLRVAECYFCYRPSPTSPRVGTLPASTNDFITFGCLNALSKVNVGVMELWARLLRAVPNSKLAIHATAGNQSVRERFVSAGAPANRLILHPYAPRDAYLNLYNQIDIALDPFPYAGGTTTLDSLWMGVPVITLPGQSPLSRMGLMLLTQLAEHDLIAASPEQYIQIATDLAGNLPRLTHLRANLKERLINSSLMDAPRYTQNLEAAYRFAWQDWCRTGAHSIHSTFR